MLVALVDWSDIREHKRLMVLRASVALQGRSVTLYEKAFPLSKQCFKSAHDQFLSDLAGILPSSVTHLIISDAGFKVPWYKTVEEHGLYWLSRARGKYNLLNSVKIGGQSVAYIAKPLAEPKVLVIKSWPKVIPSTVK